MQLVFVQLAVVTGFLVEAGGLLVAVAFEVAAGVLVPLADRWAVDFVVPVRSAEFDGGR